MSVPKPDPIGALDNACSVIVGNTFYSFSENGFVSLALEDGGDWSTLPTGVKVQGAACAGKDLDDPGAASLIVVGGFTDDPDYSGLQQYNFAAKTWETIKPRSDALKNRQGHSVVYNQASRAIVMFSGVANGGPGPSDETWKIDLVPPYTVAAANPPDSGRAATIRPMLFPWGDGADIAMVSGPRDDGTVWLIDSTVASSNSNWRPVASIQDPWDSDSAAIRATMVHGADNSMTLLKFDASRSPNVMTRITVAKAPDQPIRNAAAVTKRDLTLDNWPEYNATDAPDAQRNGFAIAQGTNGKVVLSGGNPEEPIALYDVFENSWDDPLKVLGVQKILATSSTTTTTTSTTTSTSTSTSSTFTTSISSTTTTSTTSATPTETTAAATPNKHGPSSNAILGITLGTIAAFLAILLLILLLLKRRKRRMNPNQGAVLNPDEKDTVAFAKSTQPSASPAHYRGHNPQLSTESYSSVAILMGRMGSQKAAAAAAPVARGKTSRASSGSSTSSLHKQFKSTISKPIPQPSNNPMLQAHDDRGVAFDPSVAEPRPRNGPMPAQDGTRRSSGWNKYWSGGSALQILGYGNKRATLTSERSSHYSEAASAKSGNNARATQDSATVPPLNFEAPPEVNSVNTGSPVVSQYNSKVPTEGIAGTIERPVSPLSTASGYSSGVPESINEMFENSGSNKPWGHDRAPSSIYQHSKADSMGAPQTSGVSQQPQLAMAATSSDMSWLNLGEQNRK